MNQQYYILMIVTDGDIHDMKETIDWVVAGTKLPLSIVIIGLGDEDFSNMIKLDADEEPLFDSKGRKMERDIVQFVPFAKVGNSPSRLAREVLDEVPREIVNFFQARRIFPNPPKESESIAFSPTIQPPAQPPTIQPPAQPAHFSISSSQASDSRRVTGPPKDLMQIYPAPDDSSQIAQTFGEEVSFEPVVPGYYPDN